MREWQTVTVAFSAQQQRGDRLADQVAAPDDHRLALPRAACRRRAAAPSRRTAWPAPARRGPGRAGPALVGREPVDVLARVDRATSTRARVDVAGQRQLDDDAAAPPGRRSALRRASSSSSSAVSAGRSWPIERDADLGAGAVLARHVDLRGRVVADQHGRQAGRRRRRSATMLLHLLGDLRPDVRRRPPCRR